MESSGGCLEPRSVARNRQQVMEGCFRVLQIEGLRDGERKHTKNKHVIFGLYWAKLPPTVEPNKLTEGKSQ